MKSPEEQPELHIRPRTAEEVVLKIPLEVLESLDRVAARQDMSREALLKLYLGQGLRQDLSRHYAERMLATVLSRHLESRDEVASILREIRAESSA